MILPSLLGTGMVVLGVAFIVFCLRTARARAAHTPLADWHAATQRGVQFMSLADRPFSPATPEPKEIRGGKHRRSKDAPAPEWKGTWRKVGRHAFPELEQPHSHQPVKEHEPDHPLPYPHEHPTPDTAEIA